MSRCVYYNKIFIVYSRKIPKSLFFSNVRKTEISSRCKNSEQKTVDVPKKTNQTFVFSFFLSKDVPEINCENELWSCPGHIKTMKNKRHSTHRGNINNIKLNGWNLSRASF